MKSAIFITGHAGGTSCEHGGVSVSYYHADNGRSLFDVAQEVKRLHEDKDILLIDAMLRFSEPEYAERENKSGIALVKLLRIMGSRKHIVLLSPWPLTSLLWSPENLVLASPGITVATHTHNPAELWGVHDAPVAEKPSFFQRLFGRSKTKQSDAKQRPAKLDLSKLDPLPENFDLRPFFKAGIRFSRDAKHDWANWWGMYAVLKAAGAKRLPAPLKRELGKLKNQEVLLVHGSGWQRPDNTQEEQETLSPTALKGRRIVYVDDQANEGWSEVLARVLYGAHREEDGSFVYKSNGVQQPENGFTVLAPKSNELSNMADYYTKAVAPKLYPPPAADNNRFLGAELLILDVRLDKSHDPDAITKDISGIRLLKLVREKNPGLPILVFTASQNGEVHRMLMEDGADMVWVKPGVEASTEQDFVNDSDYARTQLHSLVMLLLSQDYQVVRKCGRLFMELDLRGNTKWWQLASLPTVTIGGGMDARTYPVKSLRNGNLDGVPMFVLELLRDCLADVRQLFRSAYMRGMTASTTDPIDRAQIISRLGSLVELFHCKSDGDFEGTLVANLNNPRYSRKDYLGWLLLQARHNGSHIKAMRKCEQKDLVVVLYASFIYLMEDPLDAINESNWVTAREHLDTLNLLPWWRPRKAGDLSSVIQGGLQASARHAPLYRLFVS